MSEDKESVDTATPQGEANGDASRTAAADHADAAQDASAQKPPTHAQQQQPKQPKPFGWNIRDLAEVDPDRLLSGHVYRCSQVFNKEAVLELRIRSAIDLRKAGRRASRRAKRGDDPQYSAPERDSDSAKSLTDKARRWRSMASSSASEKQAEKENAQQPAKRPAALSESEQQQASEGAKHEHEVEADSGALPRDSAASPSSPFGAALQQQAWQQSQEQRDAEDYHADQQQQGGTRQQEEQSQQLGQPQHGQQQRRRQSPGSSDEQQPHQQQNGDREPISSAASRAAGAQRSIGKRRATGAIGPEEVIAGIGNAAAEAGDAAGDAVQQAGDAAQQAGDAALQAGNAAADALNPRPNQDGGFDLAMGKSTLEDFGIKVYQVELLPPRVKLLIFWRVPQHIKWRTIGAALTCRSPQSVMAPVVADPHMLGYAQLYCMMLDRSKPYIRRALAVFADEDNLPCVVHCTHGKDRTGLLSALLLMMCGVSDDKIIGDYERSEGNLKEDRDDAVSKAGIDTTMVQDDVIASPAATMQHTLKHLRSKYGNIEGYLKAIKLSDRLKWAIRENLLRPDALQQLPHDLKGQT